MRPRLLVLALAALLMLAFIVTGCGGGGESSTTTAKKKAEPEVQALSKADFIRQGDAICAEVNTAIGSVEESASETSSQTTQISNLYTGMVQGLQGLGQPAEKAGYSEFMGAAEVLARVEGELKKAADAEDLATEEEFALQASPAVEEFQSQAAVYGFEDCSEGPHAPEVAPESSAEEPQAVEESGGVEVAPEEGAIEEVAPEEEEFVPEEEVAPETGGAGGAIEEVAPEEGGPEGESGGIGPG